MYLKIKNFGKIIFFTSNMFFFGAITPSQHRIKGHSMSKKASHHPVSQARLVQAESSTDFFLISPIGLEEHCLKELRDWCAILSIEFGDKAWLKNAEIVKGGIEFTVGSEEIGYILNRCLKLPSRILHRLRRFSTREWRVLEEELKTVPWKKYFPHGISSWEIAASESKINNEKHIAQFLKEKFESRFYQLVNVEEQKSSGSLEKQPTKAYLRVNNNEFILSRDTSGEHLHFRGYRKHQGEAPLRENLAAFLWSFLIHSASRFDTEKALVVDPFVGSGTLLFEANLWNQVLKHRSYHADSWVNSDQEKRLEQLQVRLFNPTLQFLGVDNDQETLEKAQKNYELIRRNINDSSRFKFLHGNSLENKENSISEELKKYSSIWLISNPPYGSGGRLQSKKSWVELWEGALERYQPVVAVALGPERDCRKGMRLGRWICTDTQKFLNGGIRVVASRWQIAT